MTRYEQPVDRAERDASIATDEQYFGGYNIERSQSGETAFEMTIGGDNADMEADD